MLPTPDSGISGVVVIDKPPGWTSHQVVARLRRLLGTRKVGHAGTLDPMATGVLLVGVNRATRLLGHLSKTDKTYTATIRLGVATVTDDAEGEPIETRGTVGLDDAAIEPAMARLRGPIQQVPSVVSAIKIAGVRSYARVRAGTEVELAARPVTIQRFDLLDQRRETAGGIAYLDLDVIVDCTTGTYVRALARDLGAALGTGGHLTRLRRTRVGAYGIEEAQPVDPAAPTIALLPLADVARRTFPVLALDEARSAEVHYGRRLCDLALPGTPTALLDPTGQFLALYRPDGPDAVADAVFVS